MGSTPYCNINEIEGVWQGGLTVGRWCDRVAQNIAVWQTKIILPSPPPPTPPPHTTPSPHPPLHFVTPPQFYNIRVCAHSVDFLFYFHQFIVINGAGNIFTIWSASITCFNKIEGEVTRGMTVGRRCDRIGGGKMTVYHSNLWKYQCLSKKKSFRITVLICLIFWACTLA